MSLEMLNSQTTNPIYARVFDLIKPLMQSGVRRTVLSLFKWHCSHTWCLLLLLLLCLLYLRCYLIIALQSPSILCGLFTLGHFMRPSDWITIQFAHSILHHIGHINMSSQNPIFNSYIFTIWNSTAHFTNSPAWSEYCRLSQIHLYLLSSWLYIFL